MNSLPELPPPEVAAPTPQSVQPKLYQVPRRFNLPSVFVMTTLLAAVCGILKASNAPTPVYLFIAVMTVVTCAAQIYAPKGPRLASVVGGALTFTALGLAMLFRANAFREVEALFCTVISSALAGALLGYIFGTLAAAVFLITDRVFGRR